MKMIELDRIQRLENIEAIRNLIAHYGPLADSGDAEGVAALWAEDGSYTIGNFGEAKGRKQIGDLINSETHQNLLEQGCGHILTSPYIKLDEAAHDRAFATNHSVVFRNIGDSYEAWRVSANRWQLTATPTGWRVQHRDNHPLTGDATARVILGDAL